MKQITLDNKNSIVIGAGSGLGYELALRLVKLGSKVVFTSKDVLFLRSSIKKDLDKELLKKVFIKRVDISKPHDVDSLMTYTENKLGSIDILINSAGIASYKPFINMSDSEIESVIKTNLLGAIYVIKKSLPLMSSKLSTRWIIQIGSLAGQKVGHKFFSVYSASKEGLVGLFRSLLPELNQTGIKLILVHPPAFNSRLPLKAFGSKELIKKFNESDLKKTGDIASKIIRIFNEEPFLKEGFKFYLNLDE